MGAKKIVDNNMSQDALLRSVKPVAVAAQLDSSLKSNEKALAESILNTLLEKSEGSEDYMLRLTSKNTDALMGRIETYIDLVKDKFTSNELEAVKVAIIDAINMAANSAASSKSSDAIIKSINDVLAAVNDVVQKIDEAIQQKLDDALQSIKDLFASQPAPVAPAAPAAPAAGNELPVEKIVDEVAEKVQPANEDLSEFVAPAEEDAITKDDLEEIQLFLNQQFNTLKTTVTMCCEQILASVQNVNTAIDAMQANMQESFNSLVPSSKDKKAAKKAQQQQAKLNKIISDMDAAVKKIEGFVDNFVNVLIANFATFMNGVFKVLFGFFLKLMLGIVIPFLLVVGLALYLLAEPLMAILQPIMDFVADLVHTILDFMKPVRDFLLDVFKAVFEIIRPALEAFFKGLASVAEQVAIGLGKFVTAVLSVLELLMKGIASGAFELGKALVKFATAVVNVLALFMEGMSEYAKAIGEGLGRFVTIVLDVLCWLMEGFGTQAKAIGEAIGKVVLAVTEVVELLVQFLKECVGILVAIVGIVRDFFEGLRSKARAIGEIIAGCIYDFFDGFRTNAKAIGEKVSEIVLVMADIMLKILKFIDKAISNVMKFIRMYVVAPINGIRRKLRTFQLQLSRDFVIKIPTFNRNGTWKPWKWSIEWNEFHPFDFMTAGWTPAERQQAEEDEGKSVSDLVKDEMDKMQKKIDEEEKAEQAAELAKKLQQKKIEDMLNNMKMIEDMSNLVKEIHAKMIGEKTETAKVDFTVITDKMEEFRTQALAAYDVFKKDLFKSIEDAVGVVGNTMVNTGKILLHFIETVFKPVVEAAVVFVQWFKNRQGDGNTEEILEKMKVYALLLYGGGKKQYELTQSIGELLVKMSEFFGMFKEALFQKLETLPSQEYLVGALVTQFKFIKEALIESTDNIISKIEDGITKSKAFIIVTAVTTWSKTKDIAEEAIKPVKDILVAATKLLIHFPDAITEAAGTVVTKLTGIMILVAKKSLDKAEDLIDDKLDRLDLSTKVTMPDWKRIFNLDKIGKASTENLLDDDVENPAEALKNDNKKAAKAQSAFQKSLMEYLENMFGEILQKLDDNGSSAPMPIPITFNPNNPASLENI